jgi:hypothetical protein
VTEEDAAKKVVDCLRTEFRPDALRLQNESTAVGKLRLIEQALREPGGLGGEHVLAPKDALRGRRCRSEQLGVKSGVGNIRKEAEKKFVHYCYLCSRFVVGKWQDHYGRAHVKRVQSMLWAAITCLDDKGLELVMKAAAEPQPMSSSDEDEEDVGAEAGARAAAAADDGEGGGGEASGVVGGLEAAKKRARAAGDGEQSVETEGEDERRDGRLASDRPPEKRARLQSVETEDEERERLYNDVADKYSIDRIFPVATTWNTAASVTYAYDPWRHAWNTAASVTYGDCGQPNRLRGAWSEDRRPTFRYADLRNVYFPGKDGVGYASDYIASWRMGSSRFVAGRPIRGGHLASGRLL